MSLKDRYRGQAPSHIWLHFKANKKGEAMTASPSLLPLRL
ncbi:hypothetical protein SAMN04490197_4743 [Pseudomonas orientalis]|uniref:Uncharacterized protein n=1 Tax=Pseudomonas orientalis TaxID=76758 RepID=A0A8B3Y5D9_9PSED|nr:hypothetical protein SAMN04490197_4743 [Pseudomonas orientalis]